MHEAACGMFPYSLPISTETMICPLCCTQKPSAVRVPASRPVLTEHAGCCCIPIMLTSSAPWPGAQLIRHGWAHTQPGLSRFRPGHAGRSWPSADKGKRGAHAWWWTLLTVPRHHVPFWGSSMNADMHHPIPTAFCSFLLHSVGCCETEVLTQNHSCATRLKPRHLWVHRLQPEALPNTATFAPGFS